jgi:HEAT repeat protein
MKRRFNRRFEKDRTPSGTVVAHFRAAFTGGREVRDKEVEEDDGLGLVHYRGGKEEFRLGSEYSNSNDPLDRAVGAKILAELGWGDETYLEDSVGILLRLLGDPESVVVAAAAAAFAHRSDDRAIPDLVRLVPSPDPAVRYGVTVGLAGNDDSDAVAALIALSRDEDRDVRDYAVFALGSHTDLDTPELREALHVAMGDSDPEIRGEALVGLAERKDERVKPALIEEWKTDEISILSLEAAEVLADPDFLPYLEEMGEFLDEETDEYFQEQLAAAITACGGE